MVSSKAILYLHDRLTDGRGRVRDVEALRNALRRTRARYAERGLFLTPHARAAALLEALVRKTPFDEAGPRTAFAAAALLLELNGWAVRGAGAEDLMADVAAGRAGHPEIRAWLEERSVPRG